MAGISPFYFWDEMTLIECWSVIKAQNARDEEGFKIQWETARMISYNAVLPYAKKGFKPTDVIRFPWESKSVKPASKEEYKRIADKYRKSWQKED